MKATSPSPRRARHRALPRGLIGLSLPAVVALTPARAADPYQTLAVELATQFLAGESTDDDALQQFLKTEEVVGKKFIQAVQEAVKPGQSLVADGVPADSKHFPRLLANSTGVTSGKIGDSMGSKTDSVTKKEPAAESAETRLAAAKSLWKEGWTAFQNLTPGQKLLFQRHNAVTPEEIETLFRQKGPAPTVAPSQPEGSGTRDATGNSTGKTSSGTLAASSPATTARFEHPDFLLMSLGCQEKNSRSAASGAGPTAAETKLMDEFNPQALRPAEFAAGEYWDFESRFSYNLESNDDKTASAITGGSDISAEVGLSRHLARHRFPNGSAYSIGLDLNGGITSDRDQFDAHQRYFGGLSYNANFLVPGAHSRSAFFSARVGWTSLDMVQFLDKESRELKTIRNGRLLYQMDDAVAFETELIYPIGSTAAVTFGARIYGLTDPNTWAVQIGYTKPLSEIFGGLFPKTEKDPEKSTPQPTL